MVAGSTLREQEVRPGGKEQCRHVIKPATRSQKQTHTSGASIVVSKGLGYLYSCFHNHRWGVSLQDVHSSTLWAQGVNPKSREQVLALGSGQGA